MSSKRQTEAELMSKEINILAIKERDLKQRIANLENELSEVKD